MLSHFGGFGGLLTEYSISLVLHCLRRFLFIEVIMKIAKSWPEEWMMKSDKQKLLEQQGCIFRGQELLDNHELDPNKECYCGRPNIPPSGRVEKR